MDKKHKDRAKKMNFFKLYIGDYQRDTAHLSLAEHGAYLMMLQHYCATEKPLPTGRALHRMLRADSKTERDAIDHVAAIFWVATEGGLINKRATKEIDRAEHQRDVNREVGKRGGRPKKTETVSKVMDKKETESVSETVSETEPNNNPNHSHSQTYISSTNVEVSAKRGFPDCPHGQILTLFAEQLPMLPQPRIDLWSGQRAANLKSRWRWIFSTGKVKTVGEGLDWFRNFFGFVAESEFLTKKWKGCTLDWLMQAGNFAKAIEGKYENQAGGAA